MPQSLTLTLDELILLKAGVLGLQVNPKTIAMSAMLSIAIFHEVREHNELMQVLDAAAMPDAAMLADEASHDR